MDKPKPTWIPSNYPGYEWNTPGLDTLPSEKTTLSGTSINYSFNAFGIGYTTSTQTIDDSDSELIPEWKDYTLGGPPNNLGTGGQQYFKDHPDSIIKWEQEMKSVRIAP